MRRLIFMTSTNASGKSSIVKELLACGNYVKKEYPEFKTSINVSELHSMIIIGGYSEKGTSGGCDTIPYKAHTLAILASIWREDKDILMEGYLIGTKVWIEQIMELNRMNGNNRELNFLQLNTSLETCFRRIEKRSGKSRGQLAGNGKNVVEKHKSVLSLIKWVKEERKDWRISELDSENLPSNLLAASILLYM